MTPQFLKSFRKRVDKRLVEGMSVVRKIKSLSIMNTMLHRVAGLPGSKSLQNRIGIGQIVHELCARMANIMPGMFLDATSLTNFTKGTIQRTIIPATCNLIVWICIKLLSPFTNSLFSQRVHAGLSKLDQNVP